MTLKFTQGREHHALTSNLLPLVHMVHICTRETNNVQQLGL